MVQSLTTTVRTSRNARTRTCRPSDPIARTERNPRRENWGSTKQWSHRRSQQWSHRRSQQWSRRWSHERSHKWNVNPEGIRKNRQRDVYHQEIRGGGFQQEAGTNPHGKARQKHGSKRRGRTSNSAGSTQSPDMREAVGESDSRRSQFANQEPHLGYCSSSTRSSSCHQQVRIQTQEGRTRTNCQAEGQASGQRIQSDLRSRLPRYLRTSRQTRINQDTTRNRGNTRIGHSSDGRCDGIPGRGIGRGNLYGTARRFQSREQGGRPHVSTQEKYLRFEASTPCLEPENSTLP